VADDSLQVRLAPLDTDINRMHSQDIWEIEHQMRYFPYEGLASVQFIPRIGTSFANTCPQVRSLGHEPPPEWLLLHGDTDEIPSRHAMLHVKHCEITSLPLNFDLDFYRYNFFWHTKRHDMPFPHLFTSSHVTTVIGANGEKHRRMVIAAFFCAGAPH